MQFLYIVNYHSKVWGQCICFKEIYIFIQRALGCDEIKTRRDFSSRWNVVSSWVVMSAWWSVRVKLVLEIPLPHLNHLCGNILVSGGNKKRRKSDRPRRTQYVNIVRKQCRTPRLTRALCKTHTEPPHLSTKPAAHVTKTLKGQTTLNAVASLSTVKCKSHGNNERKPLYISFVISTCQSISFHPTSVPSERVFSTQET